MGGDSVNQCVKEEGVMRFRDGLYLRCIGMVRRFKVHRVSPGAFGTFEVTHDITQYCKAAVFAKVGKKTPLAIRFSTVGGESGSADTARSVLVLLILPSSYSDFS